MSTLVLSVGMAVTFLTVWGVTMVGSYLIGRDPEVAPTSPLPDWNAEQPAPGESDLVG